VVKGTGLSAAGTIAATAPTYPMTLNNVSISLTAITGGALRLHARWDCRGVAIPSRI
jgi:hypothetical protein